MNKKVKNLKVFRGNFLPTIVHNLKAVILDFFFPATCSVCHKFTDKHGRLCSECWNKINWITNPKCYKCGYPFPADLDLNKNSMCPICYAKKTKIDWIRSACVYDDESKNIILPFKHCGQISYATFMSNSMISLLPELPTTIDIVLPVPLAYRRLVKRGYNQAVLLARPIAKQLNVHLDLNSINRKYKSDMGHKNFAQRKDNIKNVFNVKNKNVFKDKRILLVDDVMTSGATLEELSRVLKMNGAAFVGAITFCRVVKAI